MSTLGISRHVCEIVASCANCDAGAVCEATLFSELAMDSIGIMAMVSHLESLLGAAISDTDVLGIMQARTVSEVLTIVASYTS